MSHIVLGAVTVFQEKSLAKDQGILGKLKCASESFHMKTELNSFELRNLVRVFSSVWEMNISEK